MKKQGGQSGPDRVSKNETRQKYLTDTATPQTDVATKDRSWYYMFLLYCAASVVVVELKNYSLSVRLYSTNSIVSSNNSRREPKTS